LSGVSVSEVLRQDEIVATFVQRGFRNVHEAGFVPLPAAAEAFGYVCGDGNGGAAELGGQAVEFVFGEGLGEFVGGQYELVRLLPDLQVAEGLGGGAGHGWIRVAPNCFHRFASMERGVG
jgi:hypothetical protein